MPSVIGDIVNEVITNLSQVQGKSVQLYAVPRITQHLQDAILMELEEMWWPDYMTHFVAGLDGTSGRLTEDVFGPLGFVDEYKDIAVVWPKGSNTRVREMPYGQNPGQLPAGSYLYMAPDYLYPHRPFRIYPVTTTGEVVMWARQRPKIPISISDKVYLDRLMLMYDACWMYAVDDGTIPAQVQKFQMLAAERRKKVKSSFAAQPLSLNPGDTAGINTWWQVP